MEQNRPAVESRDQGWASIVAAKLEP